MRRASAVARPSCRAAFALALFLAAGLLHADGEEGRLAFRSVLMFNQHLYSGDFRQPRSIAVDRAHGEIVVADTGNGAIGIYRPDGAELFSFSSRKYLKDPARVVVTPKGMLAVVEGDRHHVRLFNYRGVSRGDLPLERMEANPILTAIAYDPEGNAYVAESRSGQIFVYAPDGKYRFQFGSRGSDEGQFQSVAAIAIGSDGRIYVCDAQALAVQVFDNQGNFVKGWGRHEMGSDGFSLPSGIAVDSKNRIYVTDELRHRVTVYADDGKVLSQFGSLGDWAGALSFPADVAVDDKDRVYVIERQNARAQVFEEVVPPAAR